MPQEANHVVPQPRVLAVPALTLQGSFLLTPAVLAQLCTQWQPCPLTLAGRISTQRQTLAAVMEPTFSEDLCAINKRANKRRVILGSDQCNGGKVGRIRD